MPSSATSPALSSFATYGALELRALAVLPLSRVWPTRTVKRYGARPRPAPALVPLLLAKRFSSVLLGLVLSAPLPSGVPGALPRLLSPAEIGLRLLLALLGPQNLTLPPALPPRRPWLMSRLPGPNGRLT